MGAGKFSTMMKGLMMTERGIILKAHEVLAVLDGRQTMFVRPMRKQPIVYSSLNDIKVARGGELVYADAATGVNVRIYNKNDRPIHSPYGVVGDVLWGKETWSPDHKAFYPYHPVVFRVDGECCDIETYGRTCSPEDGATYPFSWRSSTQMPRRFSRIAREITGIRIMQMWNITVKACEGRYPCAVWKWEEQWNADYPKHPWVTNEFVWVIDTKGTDDE